LSSFSFFFSLFHSFPSVSLFLFYHFSGSLSLSSPLWSSPVFLSVVPPLCSSSMFSFSPLVFIKGEGREPLYSVQSRRMGRVVGRPSTGLVPSIFFSNHGRPLVWVVSGFFRFLGERGREAM
jgi:hypothetical protein